MSDDVPIVGVGVAAGDLESCGELLRLIPRDLGLAFLVIRHGDPEAAGPDAGVPGAAPDPREILARSTSRIVVDLADGMPVRADRVYLTPLGTTVGVAGGLLAIAPAAERPPIDAAFTALAAALGDHAVGVLLLGTGADGRSGLHAIEEAGGIALLQAAPLADAGRSLPRSIARGTLDLVPAIQQLAQDLERGLRPIAIDVVRRTEELLLDRYAPPGVIVDERMEILHFHGRTGAFLEPAPGQPRYDLLAMARPGLRAELQSAIAQARRERGSVRRPGVRVEPGSTQLCNLVVIPLATSAPARDHCFAVLFEEVAPPSAETSHLLERALAAADWARDYARATLEAVRTPLLALDGQLQVLAANTAFCESYGLPRGAADGHSLFAIMEGTWDLPELRALLARIRDQDQRFGPLSLERPLPGLGLRSLSLSGSSLATPNGDRLILLALDDLTERVRTERERAQLLAETQAAKASAEDASRTKDQFLATLSHELRTPLSTLLLQTQLLRRGKLDEARLRKAGEAIERATRTQARLIDDLLDISRIVTGKLRLELQAVSLATVVQAAVDAVRPIADRNQLELEVQLDESLPVVSGDPARLQQAVQNLLANAIKFSPEKGRAIVTVDSAGGRGRIRVTDDGIGIEPRYLPHLFSRFSQEDRGQTRSHGGLGLGLPIARYLLEAHGGTIEAHSPGKGHGATFTVLLPLLHLRDGAGAEAAPPAGKLTVDGHEIRVLLVEDDPGTREALAEMLGLSGADVRAAESAQRAMALFAEFHPELLICDIAMPDEDGYSLIGRIRALGPGQGGDVPAIAVTALTTDEDRRRALAAGFQLHLPKPVDIDHLVAALTTLVRPAASPFARTGG